mmetsp:Transcript_76880/g.200308  ORF Transcript_76880/g.200308 Transcript_76880/m.200308 type:complete len:385 (-) Transcript_76880:99-1253(-)
MPCVYHSREEVAAHWFQMLRDGEKGVRHASGEDVDVMYNTGNGWRYRVTLADPEDSKALCALSEEFVRTHSALFAREYKSVDHKTWCQYLGLHADMGKRAQVTRDSTSKHVGQASRYNFHAVYASGCTLKCEAMRCDPKAEVARGRAGAVGSRAGAHATLDSEVAAWDKGSGAQPEALAGFVHFSMEEPPTGGASGAARSSKRLKRKRGECTGEYTKVNHLMVTQPHRGCGLGGLLLMAVLHRVLLLDPPFARELFLTVIQKNEHAVGLYKRLGMSVLGTNTTFLGPGKDRSDKSRPIVWYQMGLNLESFRKGSEQAEAPQGRQPRPSRQLVVQLSDTTSVNGSQEVREARGSRPGSRPSTLRPSATGRGGRRQANLLDFGFSR